MKELIRFRKFLNENKEIAADYADRILGAGDAEFVDPIGLIDFYASNLDDLPEPMKADLFMANIDDIKAMVMKEGKIHEGTWGLGSPEQINDIIDGLQAIIKMADDAMTKRNAAGRGFIDGLKNQLKAEGWNRRLYNIVGDDSFHDAYDGAKRAAELNDFDRVKNKLGDAIARAEELRDIILRNRDRFEEGVNEVDGYSMADIMARPIPKAKFKIGDKVTFEGGSDVLTVIDMRKMFASDLIAYTVRFPDGKEAEYDETQLVEV